MNSAYNTFCTILQDTKNTDILYSYLNEVVKPPYDYSDLLRWQWAQAVSALDKLIHDLIRIGMVHTFQGRRSPTPKYLAFSLDMNSFVQIQSNPLLASSAFESQVVHKLSIQSFQDPRKIADGLSLIWDESNKWKCISDKMSLPEEYTKTKLKNISIRRNQIVHEGDYSNAQLQRQEITPTDTKDVMSFIAQLGNVVFQLVK